MTAPNPIALDRLSKMMRIVLMLLLNLILAGCSSMSHPLPKCDGYSRRPLNRSMWQWETNDKSSLEMSEVVPADPTSYAAAFGEEPAAVAPAAFAQFDVENSYRSCKGK
jgi:type IV secretion system protein VirB7